ncbi:MAG TPA: cytochrome-c peroxidase [Polyangia bacterium]|nr:cytochrome-c peroxidase [Polyangia bacterium]
MRRMSLVALGSFALAPLFASACNPDSSSMTTSGVAPNLDAPSVVGHAPAQASSPTSTSLPPPREVPLPDLSSTPGTTPGLLAPIKRTPMQARPISGGTLRVLSDGHTAVAADSDRDQVYIVDLKANKLLNTIALQPGDEPGRVVEDAAGRVHVALRGGGAVATIDPTRATILARRALCAAPRGLAVDAKTDTLHVACTGGELVSIATEPTTTTPSRVLELDRDLRDVVVKGDKLAVSRFRSANVLIVNADGKPESNIQLPDNALRMQADVAWRLIDGPGDSALMVHERGQESPVSTSPGGYGFNKTCNGSIVDSAMSVIDVSPTGGSSVTSSATLQDAIVGADIALSPDGSQYAVVSIAGADQGTSVQFFNVQDNSSPFGFDCETATAPHAPDATSGDAGDDSSLPAPSDYLPPSGEIVAIAYDKRGNVVVQTREPATLQVLTQRVDRIALSNDSRFDAGHQLFHTATKNRIACVSCHPEGGEDGRVWLFSGLSAGGVRRTQSLRGGIMNTAPFHWNGDQQNFGSLMHQVFETRMGGDTADDARVASLASWVNQIPTIAVSAWAPDDQIARGKTLFTSSGCNVCHAGADFTNNQNVDVGTQGQFQVPQLHGLGFRAPYMHTGCAQDLRARFTSDCGGATHGNVSGLSETQIGDLIAYLDTL